jgi:tetratricopeptide (TPR) repeat protein
LFIQITFAEEARKNFISKKGNEKQFAIFLHQAERFAQKEEFFEILNLLQPFLDQASQNVWVSYYFGVAKKGLYQNQEAKEFFFQALSLDENFVLARWHLALLFLQEKKYFHARSQLFDIQKSLNSQKETLYDLDYYTGVSCYFTQDVSCAKDFFRKALEHQNMDVYLKQSAQKFLDKIKSEKIWSFIIPIGLQYDDNILSLAQNQLLPAQYSEKSGWRSLFGILWNYDSLSRSVEPGWFWGCGAKLFYVKNYPNYFKILDAMIAETSLTQTKRLEGDQKPQFRFYQNMGTLLVNQKWDSFYFLTGFLYKKIDLNLGVQIDISSREKNLKQSAFISNQIYQIQSEKMGKILFDFYFQAQEQIKFFRSSSVAHTFEALIMPGINYEFFPKLSLRLSQTFGFLKTFFSFPEINHRFISGIGLNYAVYDDLLWNFNATYEINYKSSDFSKMIKPGVSLTLVSLF